MPAIPSDHVSDSISQTSATSPETDIHDIHTWFDERAAVRDTFLREQHISPEQVSLLREDCAFRRYYRVKSETGNRILMEAVPDDHGQETPGHRLDDFLRIGSFLRAHGLHVPAVYAVSAETGHVLMEDFGDLSFKAAAALPTPGIGALYEMATDILIRFQDLQNDGDLSLPDYSDSHVHKGRRRVVDWYMPVVLKRRNSGAAVKSYLDIWARIERTVSSCPVSFLHIDFHMENLMWCPEERGIARCGILDFQGAMTGPFVYDIANLLEDPRYEINDELRTALYNRFKQALPAHKQAVFDSWYRILATQFHCRVIGQFVKLALAHGKPRYLQYIPRLESYLRRGLEDPLLAELADWFSDHDITFQSGLTAVSGEDAGYIREDAF